MQLLKGKVTNPHTAISKPGHDIKKNKVHVSRMLLQKCHVHLLIGRLIRKPQSGNLSKVMSEHYCINKPLCLSMMYLTIVGLSFERWRNTHNKTAERISSSVMQISWPSVRRPLSTISALRTNVPVTLPGP